MKFDPDKIALDVDGMSLEQEGAYMRCVRHIWRNGPLPEARLSKVCGNAWDAVKACAAEYEGGLSFSWLEDARTDAQGRSKRASVAGSASFNSRSTDVQQPFNGRSTDVLSISKSKSSSTSKSTSQEGKERAGELTWPRWAGENTRAKWEEFKAYRSKLDRFRYKTTASEQAAINTMDRYYDNGKDMVAGIEMTMAKGWKFPVDPKELAPKQANGKPVPMTRSEAYAKLEEYRAANGIAPGGVVETHLIPADIYAALK